MRREGRVHGLVNRSRREIDRGKGPGEAPSRPGRCLARDAFSELDGEPASKAATGPWRRVCPGRGWGSWRSGGRGIPAVGGEAGGGRENGDGGGSRAFGEPCVVFLGDLPSFQEILF
jgi:hypothetical protein